VSIFFRLSMWRCEPPRDMIFPRGSDDPRPWRPVSAADMSGGYAADELPPPPLPPPPGSRRSTCSPFSTTLSSSASSLDITDFITELRQAYDALQSVREPGRLTREELGDILYLLDQDFTEELLSELFLEVDFEGRGSVDFETFLMTLQSWIGDGPRPASSRRASPPETPACQPPRARGAAVPALPPSRTKAAPGSGNGVPAVCARPISPTVATSERAHELTSIGSSSKFPTRKSRSQVLWWGFQDLADTL
jgi:hypothetical protein